MRRYAAKDFLNGLIVKALVWNPERSDHPRKTARRVCSPAKTEDEDLITRIPNIREELIAVLNLLEEAISHRATKEMFEGCAIRPYAAIIVFQLRRIV